MKKPKITNILINSLRTLGIIFALFLSISALDSNSAAEFLIQLIPGLILLGATSLSLKSPKYSGLAFIAFGLISIFFFHTYKDIEMFLIFTVPPILFGILFYISFYLSVEKNIVKTKKIK